MNQGDERNSLVPHLPLYDHLGKLLFYAQFLGGAWLRDGWAPRPGTSPKVSPIIRGTCDAQSSKLIFQTNLP